MGFEIIFRDSCVRCGSCAAVCPTHKIIMKDGAPTVHPTRNCLQCMHCASACPTKAIHFDHIPTYAEYPDTPEDETLKLLMSRRSVRHFKPNAPEQEDIQWALDIAQYAPSGKNMHPVKFIVVHGKEKCDALYQFACDKTRETGIMSFLADQRDKGNHDSVTCGCSTIILALIPKKLPGSSPEAVMADAVLALSVAELLLVKEGIGTCWSGNITYLAEVIPAIAEYLHIPKDYKLAATLLCGYPDEIYRNIPYRKSAEIDWI